MSSSTLDHCKRGDVATDSGIRHLEGMQICRAAAFGFTTDVEACNVILSRMGTDADRPVVIAGDHLPERAGNRPICELETIFVQFAREQPLQERG